MFNTGLFILEVQKRPCLWNLKDSSHSDRQLKLRAWEEIAKVFNTCSDSYSHKNVTVEVLQRKWKHLRDYYIREKKRTSKSRTETGGKNTSGRKRNSPLLEMLQFLDENRGSDIMEVNIERTHVEENFSPETNEEEDRISDYDANSHQTNFIRIEIENPLAEDNEDNADKQFLTSLLPIIKNMSPKERLKLRAQLLNPTPQECSNIDDEERRTSETRKRPKITRETDETEVNKVIKNAEVPSKRDEFCVYGEYVANKLRNIRNSHARHTAEFHINGILYKAEMGEYDNVSRHTNATRKPISKETSNAKVIESLINDEDDSNDIVKTEVLD